jgi:hypothetical protein
MLTDYQRRTAEAVSAVIRKLGGEIEFRDDGLHETVWLGETRCSRGPILVYLYEDDWSADFSVGGTRRVFERADFESQAAMIRAFCDKLEFEIAQGTFPFFQPRLEDCP